MNAWWQGLAPRERTLVGSMGVMIVIAMVYFFILEPLFSGASAYRERVATAESNLDYMKRVAPALKQSGGTRGQPTQRNNRTLLSIIDQTTKQFDLTTRGSTNSGNNKIRVQFPASSFNSMISWFGELHSKHNVQIDAVNLLREDEAGVVSGSVTIAKITGP